MRNYSSTRSDRAGWGPVKLGQGHLPAAGSAVEVDEQLPLEELDGSNRLVAHLVLEADVERATAYYLFRRALAHLRHTPLHNEALGRRKPGGARRCGRARRLRNGDSHSRLRMLVACGALCAFLLQRLSSCSSDAASSEAAA